jgi:hypothetical protein
MQHFCETKPPFVNVCIKVPSLYKEKLEISWLLDFKKVIGIVNLNSTQSTAASNEPLFTCGEKGSN